MLKQIEERIEQLKNVVEHNEQRIKENKATYENELLRKVKTGNAHPQTIIKFSNSVENAINDHQERIDSAKHSIQELEEIKRLVK